MVPVSVYRLVDGTNSEIPLAVGGSNPTVVAAVGVVIVVVGYLIRYQGMTGLINGINMATVADEERVGDLIGGVSMVIGVLVLGYAVLLTQEFSGNTIEVGFGAVVVVLAVGAVLKARGM